jgi:hypothetical protein
MSLGAAREVVTQRSRPFDRSFLRREVRAVGMDSISKLSTSGPMPARNA